MSLSSCCGLFTIPKTDEFDDFQNTTDTVTNAEKTLPKMHGIPDRFHSKVTPINSPRKSGQLPVKDLKNEIEGNFLFFFYFVIFPYSLPFLQSPQSKNQQNHNCRL